MFNERLHARALLMMMSLMIGTIVGMLLGLRFKVFILVPVILVEVGTVILGGHGLKVIVLTGVAAAASIQFGYVLGCAVRMYIDAYLHERTALRHDRLDLRR